MTRMPATARPGTKSGMSIDKPKLIAATSMATRTAVNVFVIGAASGAVVGATACSPMHDLR